MQALLRDPSLQHALDRDGFVVVPLLSAPQVERLRALYASTIRPDDVTGLYESSRHNPYAVNRTINDAIRAEVEAAGRDVFLPSRLYGGTFMVKSPVDSDVLPLHQDWSVVDEERHRSIFVWCPLVDVAPSTGCLYVLPGSHRYFRTLRSGTYPSDRFVLPVELHAATRDVALKAGEAVLYFDALFHGSHANRGDAARVVVTARVVEADAPLVYFHKASPTAVDVYEVNPEFYLTHIDALAKGEMPPGCRPRERQRYEHVAVTDTELRARVRAGLAPSRGPSMTAIFEDDVLQGSFERDGFVVIDLLRPAEVDALTAFYRSLEHAPVPEQGFQVSLDHDQPGFVRTVSERLLEVAGPRVAQHFRRHRLFTASFVTKAPNPLGVVPPHQDWTFVDETRYFSATIWCPLVDVDRHNGALGVIRGSHRLYDHVRPSPSPQYAPPFSHQLAAIFPYVSVVPLRAGQAIVFDNRTLHASAPNRTDRLRLAFGIGVTHEEAALRHYYLLPGRLPRVMEGYEVDPGFFHHYNNARLSALHAEGRTPEGLPRLGVFAVTSRDYDTGALVREIETLGNRVDPALAVEAAMLFGQAHAAGNVDSPPGAVVAAKDSRPLWKVYTPANVVREIRYRLTGR